MESRFEALMVLCEMFDAVMTALSISDRLMMLVVMLVLSTLELMTCPRTTTESSMVLLLMVVFSVRVLLRSDSLISLEFTVLLSMVLPITLEEATVPLEIVE